MKRIILITLPSLTFGSCGKENEETNAQSLVECSIFPVDCYTGEVGFYLMKQRDFTFTAYLVPSTAANEAKTKFDKNCCIQQKESFISSQLADYENNRHIEIIAARVHSEFSLTCDQPFLGKAAGTDLSNLFKVYALAEFSYPDFSLITKLYDSSKAPTLYEYLSVGSVWAQPDKYGLYFAPVMVPNLADYSNGEELTFSLHLSLSGLSSDGEERIKEFDGSFSFFPNLPDEPDIV